MSDDKNNEEVKGNFKNLVAYVLKASLVIALMAGIIWGICAFLGWTKKKFFAPAPAQTVLDSATGTTNQVATPPPAVAKSKSSASAEEDDEDTSDAEQAVFSSAQFALEENHRICLQPGDRLEIQNERGTSIKWGFPKGYPEAKRATVQFRPDGKPVDPDFVPDGSAAPLKFLVVRNRGETPATIFLRFSEWKSRQGWTPVKSGPVTTQSIKDGFNRQKKSAAESSGSTQEVEHQIKEIKVEVKLPTQPALQASTNSAVMPVTAPPTPQQPSVVANNTVVVVPAMQAQAITTSTNSVVATVTNTNAMMTTNSIVVPQAPAEKAGGSN